MPVWPFFIAISAGLTLWGWRHGAWQIPAIALCGYIAMRLLIIYSPQGYVEVIGCASWLIFAGLMVYKGGAIPGFFYALSALTYPTLFTFGFRIEHMGLSPIIADLFAALALISIGGGIYGLANPLAYRSGLLDRVQGYSLGVALRQETDNRGIQSDCPLVKGIQHGG